MPNLYRPTVIASFTVLVLVLTLFGGIATTTAQEASPTPEAVTPVATEEVPTPLPPPITAFLEAEAVVETLPAGPATISVSTVIIAPRVALRAIVTNGPVLILVDSGILTIDADAALIALPPTGLMSSLQPAATPAPTQTVDFNVADGTQILLPANTRVQLRNTTDEEVVLQVVSIAPEGGGAFGSPAQ
jgi:hypothetical protein